MRYSKKMKFGNIKATTKEGTFDSKKEYNWWNKLKQKEKKGEISHLQRQVPITLIDKSSFGREIKYIADFTYEDKKTQEICVCDAKGFETDVFKLKARLFAERYGFKIKILK